MKRLTLLLLLIFAMLAQSALAQVGQNVAVPDIRGMSVPQAAALLNQAGLRMGAETATGWAAESGLPANTIGEQSIAPGQTAESGTVIDVTVLRAANALLIYDDNDITLVNQTGGTIALNSLVFNSVDGRSPTAFGASRWSQTLQNGDCGQLWSVGRTGSKPLPECGGTILWLTTNDSGQHFWTGANGATLFAVVQDGIIRSHCQVSAVGRCEFYLDSSASPEITGHVYIAYTPDRFLIFNNTEDQWMPLTGTLLFGLGLPPNGTPISADLSLYDSPEIIGDVQRLAPGQCIYYTNNAPDARLLQPCTEIARASVSIAPPIYWNAEFSLQSVLDGQRRTCPPATEGRLTLCIVPR